VVDPDRAGVAHVGLDEGAEGREPVALHRQWVEGRQAPVLALGRQQVRRRADRNLVGEALGMGPDLGAAPVGADREVAVEPDPHAGAQRRRGGFLQLLIGKVLQPRVVADRLSVLRREGRYGLRAGPAVFLRPVAQPMRPLPPEMLRQGLEDRVGFEIRAALLAETLEAGIGAGARR